MEISTTNILQQKTAWNHIPEMQIKHNQKHSQMKLRKCWTEERKHTKHIYSSIKETDGEYLKSKREDHTEATLSTICQELDVRDRCTGIIMFKNGYTTRPYRYILYASANARPQPMPARPPARDGTYWSDPLPTWHLLRHIHTSFQYSSVHLRLSGIYYGRDLQL